MCIHNHSFTLRGQYTVNINQWLHLSHHTSNDQTNKIFQHYNVCSQIYNVSCFLIDLTLHKTKIAYLLQFSWISKDQYYRIFQICRELISKWTTLSVSQYSTECFVNHWNVSPSISMTHEPIKQLRLMVQQFSNLDVTKITEQFIMVDNLIFFQKFH